MSIKLIVGLGNPGIKYINTRHNVGCWHVKLLAKKYFICMNKREDLCSYIGHVKIKNQTICLMVPDVFINNSGGPVFIVSNFYDICLSEILVVHDELDILPGIARFKYGGYNVGHNGVRSIISYFGNKDNFYRLRVGIGHPGNKYMVNDFVLGNLSFLERKKIINVINKSFSCIEILISHGLFKATNCLHSYYSY